MTPEKLFTELLGLKDEWEVYESSYQGGNPGEVRLKVSNKKDIAKGKSCNCGGSLNCYDHVESRTWRHLNIFEHVCYIECQLPRLKCSKCSSINRVKAPWEGKIKGFSLLFEAFALTLIREMPVKSAARILGTQDTRLWRMLKAYVDEAYEQLDFSKVKSVGCDELSARKGHKYLSVFADMDTRSVLYATQGKDASTWMRFASLLKTHNGNSNKVSNVSIDMSKAYHSGAKRYFPKSKIVFDHFHVIKRINESVDEVRKREYRFLSNQDINPLKRIRWLFLKNRKNLNDNQKNQIDDLCRMNLYVSKSYQMKVTLQDIYKIKDSNLFRSKLKAWCHWVMLYSKKHTYILSPMKKAAEMIMSHFEGIVAYSESGLTNAFMEGLMSTFSAVKRKARGFSSNKYIITMLYFTASKLKIPNLRLSH